MSSIIILIGIVSASQDAIIDNYKIESGPSEIQSAMSSTYVIRYRLGMITSGTGSLMIASSLRGDNNVYSPYAWQLTYVLMGVIQSVGLICRIYSPEQSGKRNVIKELYEKIKLLVFFMITVSVFILIFIQFPEIKIKDPFLLAALGLLKLIIAFSSSFISGYVLLKFQIVNKNEIKITFWKPIYNLNLW